MVIINITMEPNAKQKQAEQVIYKLKCITIISLLFMAVEIIGGILAHSIAILADAFHLLTDVIAYVISLYAVLLSLRKYPDYLAFGYSKVQPLGAVINVGLIWVVTMELIYHSTERIFTKQRVQQPLYMLLTSVFGLCCNLYIMKVLHSSDDHNHHNCSHSHSVSKSRDTSVSNHTSSELQKSVTLGEKTKQNSGVFQSKNLIQSQQKDDSDEKIKPQIQIGKDFISEKLFSNFNNNLQDHKHNLSDKLVEKDQQGHNQNHNHNHHNHNHNHTGCSHHHSAKPVQKKDQIHNHNSNNNDNHAHNGSCSSHLNNKLVQKDQQVHSCSHDHENIELSNKNSKSLIFDNINLQAAYIHILSDIILSIGVIISALIIYLNSSDQWSYWQLADPFCTYLFSIVALYSTIGILKQSVVILLDGCPDQKILEKITVKVNPYGTIVQLKIWALNRKEYLAILKISPNNNFNILHIRQIFSQNNIQPTIQIIHS